MLLNLQRPLTLDAAAIKSLNLCDRFDEADLTTIGGWVINGYTRDEWSRNKWLKRTEAAMDLALQIQKDKTYPWPNCSNVAFPLITIAVMQFHARAYPALISGTDLVKARVVGDDPEGKLKARANRISTHMSWQGLEQDQPWEEQQDRLLLNVAVVGSAFKKSYYSPKKGHNISELVLARDLVLDYWAKSVEDCPRKTHIIPLYRNDIYERVKRETFRDILSEGWYGQPPKTDTTQAKINADNRQGKTLPQPDDTTPFTFLEQHCSLDLDGDGYAEPYIITVEKSTGCVVRIVTRFDREEDIERNQAGEIISILAMEYFTKYPFIPSPDGGIYDIGFGVLLGPLNESVNTITNQMIDAGTMQNGGGGFLGRGVKIRGGVYTFSPLEWKRVDSTGDDLRKNIVPLPTAEPSTVLFQLLSFLVNYTNRISGSTDMLVGENPGQNTPAQTAQEMVQQGEKIYSALFKRIWRAMKEEFKKLYTLNAIYLPDKVPFGENGAFALREDYLGDPSTVVPAADPQVTSETQQIQRAMAISDRAKTVPGYDIGESERRLLKAMKIDSPETLYPGPDKVPQGEDPKITIQKLKNENAQGLQQAELKASQTEFLLKMMQEQKLNEAMILELQAKASKEEAEAASESANHQVALLDALVGAAKARNEHLNTQISHLVKVLEIGTKSATKQE